MEGINERPSCLDCIYFSECDFAERARQKDFRDIDRFSFWQKSAQICPKFTPSNRGVKATEFLKMRRYGI